MRAGLRRGTWRQVPLTLGRFIRRLLGRSFRSVLLIRGGGQLGLSRWLRRRLVSLRTASDNLPVDEFVAIRMNPNPIRHRPPARRRLRFRGPVTRVFRGFRLRWLRSETETGREADKNKNGYSFLDHAECELLRTPTAASESCGAATQEPAVASAVANLR